MTNLPTTKMVRYTMGGIVEHVFNGKKIHGHPQEIMKQVGIEYEITIPQSICDSWWFFGCRDVPDGLPPCFSVEDVYPFEYVRNGLSHEDAMLLAGEAPKKDDYFVNVVDSDFEFLWACSRMASAMRANHDQTIIMTGDKERYIVSVDYGDEIIVLDEITRKNYNED